MMPMLRSLDHQETGGSVSVRAAAAINQHLGSTSDTTNTTTASSTATSTSSAMAADTVTAAVSSILSPTVASSNQSISSINRSFIGGFPHPPPRHSLVNNSRNDNKSNNNKATTVEGRFPVVLYNESDDAILGEYQTLLRQQLELFQADGHDVINGTFRQGRTTPIQLGQIGLRCKHCSTASLAIRTKGSVYFSQTIKGMYQIAQNMSKVHLCERCTRIPQDIKRRMVVLRSRRNRASGGRAYWIRHLREMGIYEDGTVLRARDREDKKNPHDAKPTTDSSNTSSSDANHYDGRNLPTA